MGSEHSTVQKSKPLQDDIHDMADEQRTRSLLPAPCSLPPSPAAACSDPRRPASASSRAQRRHCRSPWRGRGTAADGTCSPPRGSEQKEQEEQEEEEEEKQKEEQEEEEKQKEEEEKE